MRQCKYSFVHLIHTRLQVKGNDRPCVWVHQVAEVSRCAQIKLVAENGDMDFAEFTV